MAVLPVLSWASLGRTPAPLPNLWQSGSVCELASGAAAILMALRAAGVQPGDEVLVPAYHCPSMVEPVQALAARPLLYGLRADLHADFDDLEARAGARCKAVLAVHFFGFPQPLARLREFCDARGLALIEDCAHAFFGRFEGRPPGGVGDFAVGSARKFFPVHDGGYLVGARERPVAGGSARVGHGWQVKAAFNVFEEAARHGRLKPFHWLAGAPLRALRRGRAVRRAAGGASPPDSPSPAFAYVDPETPARPMSAASSWLARHTDLARVVRARRANYLQLATEIEIGDRVEMLHPELPENVVPYMFALRVRDGYVFPHLKQLGVPAWRWEDALPGECALSRRYATELVQIPCHQELTATELRWLVDALNAVLRHEAPPPPSGLR